MPKMSTERLQTLARLRPWRGVMQGGSQNSDRFGWERLKAFSTFLKKETVMMEGQGSAAGALAKVRDQSPLRNEISRLFQVVAHLQDVGARLSNALDRVQLANEPPSTQPQPQPQRGPSLAAVNNAAVRPAVDELTEARERLMEASGQIERLVRRAEQLA